MQHAAKAVNVSPAASRAGDAMRGGLGGRTRVNVASKFGGSGRRERAELADDGAHATTTGEEGDGRGRDAIAEIAVADRGSWCLVVIVSLLSLGWPRGKFTNCSLGMVLCYCEMIPVKSHPLQSRESTVNQEIANFRKRNNVC